MRGWLFLALVLIGSLFSLTGLRQFFIEPLAGVPSNIVWFVIQVLPLLIILPGLLAMSTRSAFYTILVAMLYFIHGVLLMATEPLRWLGATEVAISCALVAVATWLLRRCRERDAGLTNSIDSTHQTRP